MLAASVSDPELPAGWAGEVKWDGFRALLSLDGGQVVLRSRHGTDMAPAFPDITNAALRQLPDATALDGELIVWEAGGAGAGRIAFERLQNRLRRRGAGARQAASQAPAHYVAFDLLRHSGTDTTSLPYHQRRTALEELFKQQRLTAPWALCPSTTDPATVHEWLASWGAVGVEGCVFKRLRDPYRPGVRGWRKYKVYETGEAIVGAVTGPATAPRTLLLGRYDDTGRLRYTGRTTTLPRTAGTTVGALLTAARTGHPWTGRTFSAGWGRRETLNTTLVQPELVVEVGIDIARDASGRWRHPARFHRARLDLSPADVPCLVPPPH
ncbi:ATP-dependent DNA ligase [Streptomyces sp. NPDC017941]|uniref:ATP-dependent DNA ligase n=1 Tax=unclassified Streptomyces TaxID=2593676 RepID=UPI0037A1C2BE